ncbi:MAG: hypothetical protein IKK51_04695 [Oscillospiraceae bacterium]|nr:hypothetical protein [Oscillospiraceae bacterium]MBR4101160.1 hypothetical protein [Oscillospiraceae bacterium]
MGLIIVKNIPSSTVASETQHNAGFSGVDKRPSTATAILWKSASPPQAKPEEEDNGMVIIWK